MNALTRFAIFLLLHLSLPPLRKAETVPIHNLGRIDALDLLSKT